MKISDFGLSRLATGTDYDYVPTYATQLQRMLPIRWMAPECIESSDAVYSEKTDVVRIFFNLVIKKNLFSQLFHL